MNTNIQTFNVTKQKGGVFVKTNHNAFQIVVDDVKGIGIYQDFGDSNSLIKSYSHTKTEKAIEWLFKTNIF